MKKALPQVHLSSVTDDDLEKVWLYPHLLGNLAGKEKMMPLHGEWVRYIWDANEERALMGHRGSRKTTGISAVGSLRWLLFHPDVRIAIVRKTFSDAAEVIDTVHKMMEQPAIKELFRYAHGIYPKAIRNQYGKRTYNFKQTATPEGSITAHGLDGSLTGKHYDIIIADDFVTKEDRYSRAERERTKATVQELATNIVDPGHYVRWIGTPWHEDDAWSDLAQRMPIPKFTPADTGILTPEEIVQKKRTTSPSLYAANYDLELKSDESALFKDPQRGDWQFVPGAQVWGHVDAAFDGDHYCAFTIMSRKPTGRIQAVGWVYPGNIKDWITFIAAKYKYYRCLAVYNETNPDKGWTAQRLAAAGMTVRSYSEKQNKHAKIATHLYEEWENIDWVDQCDPDYIAQLCEYTEGQEPDDAPDSAASLVRERFKQAIMKHWRIPA